MFSLTNYLPIHFLPPLDNIQQAGNILLEGLGFQPTEIKQIQNFFDYFDFDDSAVWFNEPLINPDLLKVGLSLAEIKQLRHGISQRPDAIIFRPPNSIFLLEFTRQLTSRTFGQLEVYESLYRQFFKDSYNLHKFAICSTLNDTVAAVMLTRDIFPILAIEHELEEAFTPDYCNVFFQAGSIDAVYIEPDFFKVFDNHFQNPPEMPKEVV